MDSIDPRFSFEITDHQSNVVAVSMVTEKCDHEYTTRASDDITFSPAVHDEDGRILVSAEESRVQKRDNISSNQYPNIESKFHEYQALCNRNPDSINKNVDAGLADQLDQSSYFGATSAISTKPGLKEARNNPEAFQRHGIHRCLQFEEASNTLITRPAQSPFDSGGPEPPLETPCTPIKGKETEKIQPLYPSSMNSTVNVPKPSGIGLHLNSIVNVLPSGSGAVVRVKSAQNCHFSIRGKKSIHTINSPLFDRSPVSAVLNPAENESEWVDDNGTVHASTADKSFTSLSIVSIKSSNNSVDNQSAQGNRSEHTKIETDGNPEEFKTNTDKKRKRSSNSGGGCKRCHCKKSKCLKLYCDCFAAGLYCAGSCACQGCYNRPEYENMVLESRQQIESRNPLAFAPKIVEHIVEPPASIYEENESSFIPSLARHKRGCSCKKSMCLKKYCECYHKSNVGCSDGCRCEGCQNVYGQKPESTFDKDFLSKESTTERADGSLAGRTSYVNGGLCHSELTPRTPSIQLFKKDVPQGCLRPRQCFQSPGSSDTLLTPNAMIPWSPTNSDNNTIVSKTVVEVVDLASPPRELCYDISETPNKFLTVVHQTGKTGNLPSLLDSEERTNHLKVQSFTGNDRPSSAGSTRYLKAVDLDGDLSNAIQDDTPDILKDCPAPLSAVKSSSPNKKRVSPPHAPRHEHGLRSLNGLRSGRKFILKAVPSTPPLTPPSVGSVRAVPGETDAPP